MEKTETMKQIFDRFIGNLEDDLDWRDEMDRNYP